MARTKILLIKDVPNLGQAGDVLTVAAGYARNYLIPRGEAVLATKGALKQAEQIREAAMRRRAKERADAEAQAEVIRQQRLLFQVKAGEKGRLYGSVTTGDIAERLEELLGFEIDRRKIQLATPIRELGLYQITIRLMPEVEATFPVAVVQEGETWEDAERRQKEAEEAAAEEAAAKAAAEMVAEAEEAAAEEAEEQMEAETA